MPNFRCGEKRSLHGSFSSPADADVLELPAWAKFLHPRARSSNYLSGIWLIRRFIYTFRREKNAKLKRKWSEPNSNLDPMTRSYYTEGLPCIRVEAPEKAFDCVCRAFPELPASCIRTRLHRPFGFCSGCVGASHPAPPRPRSARGASS
jgi:hypothetical protein